MLSDAHVNRRARVNKFAIEAQKYTPAGVAILLNAVVLFLFGTLKVRQESEKNGDTIEAVIGDFLVSSPSPAPPAGGSGQQSLQATIDQMVMTPPTSAVSSLPSTAYQTAPTFKAPDFQPTVPQPARPMAKESEAITTKNQVATYSVPTQQYAFQYVGQILDEMKADEALRKAAEMYAGQIVDGQYPLQAAQRRTRALPASHPLKQTLNRVQQILNEAERRATAAGGGGANGVGQGQTASLVPTAPDGSIQNYVRLSDVPRDAYGSGTGKKYRAQGDKMVDQKILILVSEATLRIAQTSQTGQNADALAILKDLQSHNNVTVQTSKYGLGTFATVENTSRYTSTAHIINEKGELELGAESTPVQNSIAKALEGEIAQPRHDVVVILTASSFRTDRSQSQGQLSEKSFSDEAKAFVPYLQRSGIRIYYVDLNSTSSRLPDDFVRALSQMGGGYYKSDRFLNHIQQNRNSRL